MTTQTKPMTAEELLKKEEDGFRYELVEGDLRRMTPAGNIHGYIAANFLGPLQQHVRAGKLGRVYAAETGFRLTSDPDTVRAPDVAFISRGRLDEAGEVSGYWPGAPDLAVEVVSPSDTHTEVTEKSLAWLGAGCRMVLAVDPSQRTVTVYRSREDIGILTGDDIIDGADVVPGFALPVSDLFD